MILDIKNRSIILFYS